MVSERMRTKPGSRRKLKPGDWQPDREFIEKSVAEYMANGGIIKQVKPTKKDLENILRFMPSYFVED